jgi:hypothetical protein
MDEGNRAPQTPNRMTWPAVKAPTYARRRPFGIANTLKPEELKMRSIRYVFAAMAPRKTVMPRVKKAIHPKQAFKDHVRNIGEILMQTAPVRVRIQKSGEMVLIV